MKTYIEAYHERLERNNKELYRLAMELKKKGFEAFVPKSALINYVHVRKDGKGCFFGFSEVPYKWYISCEVDPREKRGDSYTALLKADNGSTTEVVNGLTVDEIIEKVNTVYSHEKQLFYLTKI